MSEIRCPQCTELGRLPADVSPTAKLRCPWCGEEFEASAALAQLPPEFEVVSEGGTPAEADAFAQFAALAAAERGGESPVHEAAPGDEADGVPDFSRSESNSDDYRTAYAPRASEGGRGWEFAKIAAGAVLAIPAATLILLWLPGKWQRDPLGVGPKIGEFAPWLVPANLRPASEQADAENAAPPDTSTSKMPPLPEMPPDKSSQPRAPRTLDTRPPDESKHRSLTGPSHKTPRSDSTKSSTNAEDHEETSKLPPLPTEVAEAPRPPALDNADDAVGVYDAPIYDVNDFRTSLAAAEASWTAWTSLASDPQIEPPARAEIESQLFATLGELGERAVFVRPDAPEIPMLAKETASLLANVAQDGSALAKLGNHAAERLGDAESAMSGILVYGTVTRVRPHGRLFETQVDLAARNKRKITILSITDPRNLYQKGDRILVLGCIVDEPSLKVAGYNGSESRVVMGGLPYVLGSKSRAR